MKPTADYEDRDGFVAWAILPWGLELDGSSLIRT